MVLAKEARADACVVDGYKSVVLVGLLGMLAMVEVAQVELLTFEKDHCQSIKGQSAAYVIVQYSSAQVEPLVILAGLCKLALFLGKFAHLEVDMGLFHKITLLNARLGFHYKILC